MKPYGQFDIRGFLSDQAGKDLLEKTRATKVFLPEITQIVPNPANIFPINPEETDRLAENIEENGILHDMLCYREENNYTLVSGHRRLAALQKLLSEGKQYSYHGMDITGKAPVTLIDNPRDEHMTTLQIISANHSRNMSADEKKEIIMQTLTCLKELEQKGKYQWPKGIRTCTVLAEKTGISEHFIKDYMAKAGLSKSADMTISCPPANDEKAEKAKSIKALKKAIRSFDRKISTFDWGCLADGDRSEIEEIKMVLREMIDHVQKYTE